MILNTKSFSESYMTMLLSSKQLLSRSLQAINSVLNRSNVNELYEIKDITNIIDYLETALIKLRIFLNTYEEKFVVINPSAKETNSTQLGSGISAAFPITIQLEQDIYKITGPALCHKDSEKKTHARYIIGQYEEQIKAYFNCHPAPLYDKYIIVYYHNQDTIPAHIRDNDNFEVKNMTNLIARFFSKLFSDQGDLCFLFQASKFLASSSKAPFTEIYVMPQKSFAKWCAKQEEFR